ncbi:unnamed protein product [Spirodela intermedia]|uniref:Uncharacterized protein n=1 Tax=Spirodela intermedia TaxID=51605 RepID=A0A7I8IMA1_SPIIN|nr:unnamed protein product [Spirodela intermedia]CAA6659095.1 unnamed protein product [Spirodela intermedia]
MANNHFSYGSRLSPVVTRDHRFMDFLLNHRTFWTTH